MEMEMEINPASDTLDLALEGAADRLTAVAGLLERVVARFNEIDLDAASRVPADARGLTLEKKLAEAEATIASLRAEAAARSRTPAGHVSSLVAKHAPNPSSEPGALDAALRTLSIEQRIAVKSELLRAGLLT